MIGKENKECEYYYASRHILNSNTSRRFKIFAFFFNSFDEKRQLFQKISSKSKIDTRFLRFLFFSHIKKKKKKKVSSVFYKNDHRR